jgi:ABC-type transport system involved in multi-copper enzyme maturation permease subunit
MRNILLLSKFFLKDLVYRKIFFVALGLGLSFVFLSLLLGPLSYNEQVRLAINFSLAGSQIALIFLSVLVGADFLKNDIETQSIHSFLSRPLSRLEYYLGKFLAFALCLSFLSLLMWLGFFLVASLTGLESSLKSLIPYVGVYIESLILFSFAMMASLFSSSLMSVGASFTLFLVGHWIEMFRLLSEKAESGAVKMAGTVLSKIIPNLESLNWKSHLTYNEWLSPSSYLEFSLYGFSWITFLVVIGYLIFSKRDFS